MAGVRAYVALGSNLGDRGAILMRALKLIDATEGIDVTRVSNMIETAPVSDDEDQPKYLNGVIAVETTLTPGQLLGELQAIEAKLGRDRANEQRWGPRTCDLDILLMDAAVIDTLVLTVPHPRMAERRFVLEPLAEIAPDVVVPTLARTASQLLAELEMNE